MRAAPKRSTSACCSIPTSTGRCRRTRRVRGWPTRSPTCASASPRSARASRSSCWHGRRASNRISPRCAMAWTNCARSAMASPRVACGGWPAAFWKPCSRAAWITTWQACANSSARSTARSATCRTRARKCAVTTTRANWCAPCCFRWPMRRQARAAPTSSRGVSRWTAWCRRKPSWNARVRRCRAATARCWIPSPRRCARTCCGSRKGSTSSCAATTAIRSSWRRRSKSCIASATRWTCSAWKRRRR